MEEELRVLRQDFETIQQSMRNAADSVHGTNLPSVLFSDLRHMPLLRGCIRFAICAPTGTSLVVPVSSSKHQVRGRQASRKTERGRDGEA